MSRGVFRPVAVDGAVIVGHGIPSLASFEHQSRGAQIGPAIVGLTQHDLVHQRLGVLCLRRRDKRIDQVEFIESVGALQRVRLAEEIDALLGLALFDETSAFEMSAPGLVC